MALGYVGFDPTKPVGSRFTQPEVRAEIAALAPTAPPDGSIGAIKLATNSVITEKIANGAVTTPKYSPGSVDTTALGPTAVTTAKVADDAITRPKAGVGVVTCRDTAGNDSSMEILVISSTDFATIGANEDPNTSYWIYDA